MSDQHWFGKSAEVIEKAVVRYEVFCRDLDCDGPDFIGEYSDYQEAHDNRFAHNERWHKGVSA